MTGIPDDSMVQRRAAKLSALLGATDGRAPSAVFPAERIARARRRATMTQRLRIAAAALLLLTGFGVPPVRAWIVGRARTLWTRVTGPAPASSVPASTTAPNPSSTMGVVSVPAGGEFTLRIATLQAAGELSVLVTDTKAVSASVSGHAEGAELSVFPDGIRIANTRATTSGWELHVPVSVGRLVIQVGHEPPRTFHPARVGERWTISLTETNRRER
jgi:hypothetical protein